MTDATKICSRCGKRNSSDNAYCDRCGWPLDAQDHPDA